MNGPAQPRTSACGPDDPLGLEVRADHPGRVLCGAADGAALRVVGPGGP